MFPGKARRGLGPGRKGSQQSGTQETVTQSHRELWRESSQLPVSQWLRAALASVGRNSQAPPALWVSLAPAAAGAGVSPQQRTTVLAAGSESTRESTGESRVARAPASSATTILNVFISVLPDVS